MNELPRSWAKVALADVCDVVLGQSPPGSAYNDEGRGLPFFQGKAEFGPLRPTPRKWTTQGNKIALEGDVLVSVRAPVGPTNLAPGECVIGRGLAALRPTAATTTRFVLHQMRATTAELTEIATGSTFAAVSGDQLRRHRFRLPPLPEQERIVAAIEEQFSRLDAAEAALRETLGKSNVLTKGLIQAAEQGQRTQFRDLLLEPLVNGRSVPTAASGFPVLRLTALRDGRIDLSERKTGAWSKADAERFLVRKGDFFIARGNGSLALVGRGALLEVEPDHVAFPDTMIRARVNDRRIDPRFLQIVWNGPETRSQIENAARTTAGIYKVNQRDLERIVLPVPPLALQRTIINTHEQRVTVLDALMTAIDHALVRSNHLRRAILNEAFTGRLVPQDPNDEPASELLDRLAVQRADAPKSRRRQRA